MTSKWIPFLSLEYEKDMMLIMDHVLNGEAIIVLLSSIFSNGSTFCPLEYVSACRFLLIFSRLLSILCKLH
jgi:hypothetical protein